MQHILLNLVQSSQVIELVPRGSKLLLLFFKLIFLLPFPLWQIVCWEQRDFVLQFPHFRKGWKWGNNPWGNVKFQWENFQILLGWEENSTMTRYEVGGNQISRGEIVMQVSPRELRDSPRCSWGNRARKLFGETRKKDPLHRSFFSYRPPASAAPRQSLPSKPWPERVHFILYIL